MRRVTLAFCLLLFMFGCNSDKIAGLEKQNKELRAELSKRSTVADYDLQAKCSKDAKLWFQDSYPPDKDTILLNYTNHYNKKLNKCFIVVEYHFGFGGNGGWIRVDK